jgi:hypothetical protein
MFSARRKSERILGIEILGDAVFCSEARQALSLLQPLPEFSLIRSHLAAIRQGHRSGVTAWAENPVFTVGAPTWSHSPQWFAGAIAHDAFHAKLFRDAQQRSQRSKPKRESWSGEAAERACLLFQRDVLTALGADPMMVQHVQAQLRKPTYQGRSQGIGGWLDYRKRWW